MNILVTGGAGFIGSHVCESVLKSGHKVCLYDNFSDFYTPAYKHANVRQIQHTANVSGQYLSVVEGDILDKCALRKCFEENGFDAVIHLAACAGVRPSIENAQLYLDVNVNGTVCVLECMSKYGIKNLLFASSSSVYGNNKKTPFSEDDPVDNPISPYAAAKKAGELICHTYHHLYDINVACLRFFTVYGARQRPDLAIYKFTDKIIKGEPLPFHGDGTMGRDFTFIDDIVDGVMLALNWICLEGKKFEIFNLGEAYPVKLADMVKILENAIGLPAQIQTLPVPPGDVDLTWADISKPKNVLGYNPSTSFENGVQKFVQWFKAERSMV